MNDELSPMLGSQPDQLADSITGDEPMLSGHRDLVRLGKMQTALLAWMRERWADPGVDDISLLDVWRWVFRETGYEDRSERYSRRSSKRERYYRYTNARLAALLHSFIRRA